MTAAQQFIAQMRPEEAGTAGDKAGGHSLLAYGLRLRHGLRAAPAAALAAALVALLAPAGAAAWSPATAIYTGARPQPLALAGDAQGNGIGVMSGSSSDSPLLLLQRDGVASIPDGVQFAWNPSIPFPGGVPTFTTSTPLAEGAGAAGGGEGAGALVVRFRVDGVDTLSALVRDAGDRFPAEAATVVPGDFDRLSDPVVAISQAGTTVVGFTATRSTGRRAAYVARLSGGRFGNPRVLSLTGAGPLATAVGPREAGLVAWTRSGRAELNVLDDRARAGRYRVLGKAATNGDIAATGTPKGALVAWEGPGGSIRVIRRGSASSGVFTKPQTARARNGSDVSGLTAALDPFGIAYLTWREGSGSKTRILVARAASGRRFTIDGVARGSGLGRPASAARPIGGAVVGWAAKVGWQARRVPSRGRAADPVHGLAAGHVDGGPAHPAVHQRRARSPRRHVLAAAQRGRTGLRRDADHGGRSLITRPGAVNGCFTAPRPCRYRAHDASSRPRRPAYRGALRRRPRRSSGMGGLGARLVLARCDLRERGAAGPGRRR